MGQRRAFSSGRRGFGACWALWGSDGQAFESLGDRDLISTSLISAGAWALDAGLHRPSQAHGRPQEGREPTDRRQPAQACAQTRAVAGEPGRREQTCDSERKSTKAAARAAEGFHLHVAEAKRALARPLLPVSRHSFLLEQQQQPRPPNAGRSRWQQQQARPDSPRPSPFRDSDDDRQPFSRFSWATVAAGSPAATATVAHLLARAQSARCPEGGTLQAPGGAEDPCSSR